MNAGETQSFYVQPWMTKATYGIAAIQVGAALGMVVFARLLGIGPLLPALFAFGGVLTAYVGHWTARTPLATIAPDGIRFQPALLAPSKYLRFEDVRAFARVPPGWLVLLTRDGEETRVPLTAFESEQADALVRALHQHLTEVSYVED